jgi:bifunctional non-homologous end joining protein LigD
VSTPVTWDEVEKGFALEEFHLRNVPERVRRVGDLWAPLLQARGRVRLEKFLSAAS